MDNRSFDKNVGLRSGGFTILELMIAITIFGFLMLCVSQVMRSEFKLYNNISKQSDLDHNARSAMMHILDEMRLVPDKSYYSGDAPINNLTQKGYNSGVYVYPIDSSPNYCLIDENPPVDPLTGKVSPPDRTVIFFDKPNHKLWYRDGNGNDQLISDQIQSLVLTQEGAISHKLVKIDLVAEDPTIQKTYELVSYMRLY
ncbi:prepilin-type N-terminal cleavage/methylation domain-containing protein [Desulfosporosinus sp. FKB]|uniref:PilW family protein n=1 Tax=Desulfosporosinus sp. FKB TaxID=1969835 RepID=UPI000B49E8FF|nr:prepilin-type N-terminal cleavage/methylation domain-containing protein [Desulfosporosinus sp. FKB]